MTDRILPKAVLESHIGIMGKTGSGKSNLAKVLVEELLDDGARVCVIDPTGTWFGLRLTPERKPSRFNVVMFGGKHADIPIAKTHGIEIAATVGTTATPAIIDTRTMTVGERTAFIADFAALSAIGMARAVSGLEPAHGAAMAATRDASPAAPSADVDSASGAASVWCSA